MSPVVAAGLLKEHRCPQLNGLKRNVNQVTPLLLVSWVLNILHDNEVISP
jgi:hypothetical protein